MDFNKNQGGINSQGNGKKHFSEETQSNEVSWINNVKAQAKTTEELIELIVAKIEAKPIFYKHVNVICNHLNQVMRFFYQNPSVEIKLFGSAYTKLATEESDVDIFLDFGGNLPEPPDVLLHNLRNKVRKFGYFTRSISIHARAPIIHCVHRSGISCDFSFTSALSVSNSNLIKFFLSLDKRIRPLILILKFLLKREGLLGRNAITSFCLIILVLFFLQQLQSPLIPSISYLQKLATTRDIVCGWDASFTTDVCHLPKVNNDMSVTELLQNFFLFYASFEFGFFVISAFTGKSYLKPVFSDPNLLPEELNLYKENCTKEEFSSFDYNKFMCVQSPFNHSINIAKSVTEKCLVQFQQFCYKNSNTGKGLLDKNRTDENISNYLVKLFDFCDEDGVKRKNLKTNSVTIFVGPNLTFDSENCNEDNLRKGWSKNTFSTVKEILVKIMKCDIEPMGTENESLSFVDDEKAMKCEFHYPELIQKMRNGFKSEFDFPKDMSILNKEEIISSYICETVLKDSKKQCLKFEMRCSVRQRPTCFCIDLESCETEKARIPLIQQVFQFIKNNFPKWIK